MDQYPVHTVISAPTLVPQGETMDLPPLVEEYLLKIIELCRSNDVELVLMAATAADLLGQAGLPPDTLESASYCAAVTRGSEFLGRTSSEEVIQYGLMAEDTYFSFGPVVVNTGNPIAIFVGSEEYSAGKAGLNLTVFDTVTGSVVDCVNIDMNAMSYART